MQNIARAGKYVLFFGAGASKPFGIPDMRELTDHVGRSLDREADPAERELWHVVVSSLPQKEHRRSNLEVPFLDIIAGSLLTFCRLFPTVSFPLSPDLLYHIPGPHQAT